MRTALIFFISGFMGLLLFTGTATAQEDSQQLPAPVLKALKRYGLATHGLSIYVHEIGQPQPLLAVAADTPRNPASVMKLLTTLVALEELGPAYTWKTEAYVIGKLRNGILDGDVYLKGYGDPYLVLENFWVFLRNLRQAGLQTIQGDLVLDQSYFAPDPGDPADFDGRPTRAYNVLPSALLVNFQAVNIRFLPDEDENRVHIIADPLPADWEVDNRLKLKHGRCRGWSRGLGMQFLARETSEAVLFSGRYNARCGDNGMFRVISESVPYIHGAFKDLWSELGGQFNGSARAGHVPAEARLLTTGYSPPLMDIIRFINKFSNNVMARQVFLTLGAELHSTPGDANKAVQVINAWLKRHEFDFPELVIDNGAGLSREERISARHLGQLLMHAYQSPTMPEFISSLPLLAVDGTLRHRQEDAAFAGRAHLKTGSITGVRAQAGYVLDKHARRWVVVSLHNDPRARGHASEAVQNALLEWMGRRP